MSKLDYRLPGSWDQALDYDLGPIAQWLREERCNHQVFPPRGQVFNALSFTDLSDVKVVILGQDPYHDDGQAHGLSFSVPPDKELPPSLRNIYQEFANDLGVAPPTSGDLTGWAKQGVLLLNTVLTVRAHQAFSHRNMGWEQFTDSVIRAVDANCDKVVFILWGAAAGKKKEMINTAKHLIITSPHPSPLSAHRGFFGSRPFSRANTYLYPSVIDWTKL